nr:hypothetical protein [Shewanella shenzhenensis]
NKTYLQKNPNNTTQNHNQKTLLNQRHHQTQKKITQTNKNKKKCKIKKNHKNKNHYETSTQTHTKLNLNCSEHKNTQTI